MIHFINVCVTENSKESISPVATSVESTSTDVKDTNTTHKESPDSGVPPSPRNDPVSTTTTTITTTIIQEDNTGLTHDDTTKKDDQFDNSANCSDKSTVTDSSRDSEDKVKIPDSNNTSESKRTKSPSGRTLWDRPWSPDDDDDIAARLNVTQLQIDQ